ncbi:MAG: radical SAM protein [bacterium]
MESPDYVRLSLAAAMTLRLASGRFYRNCKLYCLNLLLTYSNGCIGRCSYCGLSKEREGNYENKSFIRVSWPVYHLFKIFENLNYAPHLERVCISMITNKRAIEDTIKLTKLFKEKTDLLISLLISPTITQDVRVFKEAGADMIGIAIDCATESLFKEHRPIHQWRRYWKVLENAIGVFGRNKVSSHLIVGLGEKEKEMVEVIQKIRDKGADTHLFSFYPEEGSSLQKRDPCPASQFRRIQLARYLIENGIARIDNLEFDEEGRIIDFGKEIEEIIESGKPFQTSGCPGKTRDVACNRPFGDGRPSDIRSFPFKLNKRDVKKVRKQLGILKKI